LGKDSTEDKQQTRSGMVGRPYEEFLTTSKDTPPFESVCRALFGLAKLPADGVVRPGICSQIANITFDPYASHTHPHVVTETCSCDDRIQAMMKDGHWQAMTPAEQAGTMRQATQGHMALDDIAKMAARAE
jgi:hypothetical protein